MMVIHLPGLIEGNRMIILSVDWTGRRPLKVSSIDSLLLESIIYLGSNMTMLLLVLLLKLNLSITVAGGRDHISFALKKFGIKIPGVRNSWNS